MPHLTHHSGQKTFYFDDFSDLWTPTETILIHHGWGRNSNFWYKWIPVAKKYRVIRRDALGHGYSSAPPKDHPKTIDSLSDEIIDTLD
jgi:pimeloyl-ACP methyl ester carboxylesterase